MRLEVVFQITLAQNRVWQDKPINVLVAKFPNFPAKPGESNLRILIGFAPWKSALIERMMGEVVENTDEPSFGEGQPSYFTIPSVQSPCLPS